MDTYNIIQFLSVIDGVLGGDFCVDLGDGFAIYDGLDCMYNIIDGDIELYIPSEDGSGGVLLAYGTNVSYKYDVTL